MKKETSELIDHIKERLQSHEENYDQGAWEGFVRLEKKKLSKSLLLRISAAASILLLLGTGVYFYFQSPKNRLVNNVATLKIALPNSNLTNSKKATINRDSTSLGNNTLELNNKNNLHAPIENLAIRLGLNHSRIAISSALTHPANADLQTQLFVNGNTLPNNLDSTNSKQMTQVADNKSINKKKLVTVDSSEKKEIGNKIQSGPKYARGENLSGYFESKSEDMTTQKWDMGVVVIPSMGNDNKLNMGYGLTVGYKLSSKLSLNSGLAYTALSGSADPNSQSIVSSENGRTLSSINANVTGVNVPIELRYHISEKLYIGAGVSALAVISNKEQNNYAISQIQYSSFVQKNGNLIKPTSAASISSNATKEDIPNSQIDNKNFAGFINFSFGYKQKLNKRKSVSLEPFVAIPMNNNFSKQNIHLTDVGVRLKVGL